MANTNDFLVEIGTEELPPKALNSLMTAFAAGVESGLADAQLNHQQLTAYASPRRLAVLVRALDSAQADRQVDAKGPPVNIAFADDGQPTAAAEAFARKCGVAVDALQRVATDKGEWLSFSSVQQGKPAVELLPQIVEKALQQLPIPRRMRWGEHDAEFVRPVHWLLMLMGAEVIPANVFGNDADNKTFGHRFMAPGAIEVSQPSAYEEMLYTDGKVVADFVRRETRIRDQVNAAAERAGGVVAADDDLFEEVAALTEWPVAMIGQFSERFLSLPAEVITASLTSHQRYFPIAGPNGQLLAQFVFVANLDSNDPNKVREGNEKVILPRLADAEFFWEADRRTGLAARNASLDNVVYQQGLGSLLAKSQRVEALVDHIGTHLGAGVAGTHARRAATLAKCDLLTGMVGEFPELQGVMGSYYATADGEDPEVAVAIREHYMPRFAGDQVPDSPAGTILALADRLDTLAGVFALGKKPSGNKDPFGLRRAALGVVRILLERNLELGLRDLVKHAVALQPVDKLDTEAVVDALHVFVVDRLRSFYVDRPDVSVEMFDAVDNSIGSNNMPLPDFDQRIQAVQAFVGMSESASLAAANKRISNILQKSAAANATALDEALLQEDAEKALWAALGKALEDVRPMQSERRYAAVLARLADLREPVDRFFDEVMVMADDEELQRNRLALLAQLREPFHSVADISRLSPGKQ